MACSTRPGGTGPGTRPTRRPGATRTRPDSTAWRGCRPPTTKSRPCSGRGGTGWRRRGSTSRRRGTIWRRRCGAAPGCAQPSPLTIADHPDRPIDLDRLRALLARPDAYGTPRQPPPPGVGSAAAGAGGPMQFLAATFTAVAARHPPPPGGAHPPSRYNPHDAVYTAAASIGFKNADRGGRSSCPAAHPARDGGPSRP
jgi:hypothetical protein